MTDMKNLQTCATTPMLRCLPPGVRRYHDHTVQVYKFPGLNPKGCNIALVHGIGASALSWMALVKPLARYARSFLMLDLPGHGFSPDPQPPYSCIDAYNVVNDCLIDNLEPYGNNLIIGNSLGGAFALKFCLDNPDVAQRAVLMSPAGAPFPTCAEDVIRPFLPTTLSDACKIIERIWTNPKLGNYIFALAFLKIAEKPGFQSMLESIISIDKDPNGPIAQMMFSQKDIEEFPIPALFIWGDYDHILPMEMRTYFDKYFPQTVERYFPEDLGHCPHYEDPKRIAEKIGEWLKK